MDEGKKGSSSGSGRGVVQFFFVLSVVVCVLLYAPPVFVRIPYDRSSSFIGGAVADEPPAVVVDDLDNQVGSPCSSMRNNSICCDRRDFNTDVCFMAGDVRTDGLSVVLMAPPTPTSANLTGKEEERIRPYTRKWERFIMGKVHEVRLVSSSSEQRRRSCDVRHDAPVLVMTAGGYTGNLFHAVSDGFLPAWVTAQHLRRRVVLGVLAYNPWWAGTFSRIIAGLSAHDVVDLVNDRRTHCFPGAIVGTRFHGILSVDPARLKDNKSIVDFHQFLAEAYSDSDSDSDRQQQRAPARRPRLGMVSRKGTRVIENEREVADLARSVGFDVDILETANGLPLSAVYASVSACDALLGVHGADLTKFLFLRPGPHASLTQIAPLGLSPIARDCFGKPAQKMGLRYEQYEVRAHESSLSRRYPVDDVVVADPEKAKRNRGWSFVAQVYLKGQNVTLDLTRIRDTLARMHDRALLRLSSPPPDLQHQH